MEPVSNNTTIGNLFSMQEISTTKTSQLGLTIPVSYKFTCRHGEYFVRIFLQLYIRIVRWSQVVKTAKR